MGVNKIIHGKNLEQCLAQSKLACYQSTCVISIVAEAVRVQWLSVKTEATTLTKFCNTLGKYMTALSIICVKKMLTTSCLLQTAGLFGTTMTQGGGLRKYFRAFLGER